MSRKVSFLIYILRDIILKIYAKISQHDKRKRKRIIHKIMHIVILFLTMLLTAGNPVFPRLLGIPKLSKRLSKNYQKDYLKRLSKIARAIIILSA